MGDRRRRYQCLNQFGWALIHVPAKDLAVIFHESTTDQQVMVSRQSYSTTPESRTFSPENLVKFPTDTVFSEKVDAALFHRGNIMRTDTEPIVVENNFRGAPVHAEGAEIKCLAERPDVSHLPKSEETSPGLFQVSVEDDNDIFLRRHHVLTLVPLIADRRRFSETSDHEARKNDRTKKVEKQSGFHRNRGSDSVQNIGRFFHGSLFTCQPNRLSAERQGCGPGDRYA